MGEHLALKTDKATDWEKRKLRSAIKDLTPRPIDQGRKSTWAHCEESHEASEVVGDPTRASCALQALALFFFEQRSFSSPRRNLIRGVSLVREAVRADLIQEDTAAHPVKNYEVTHRSLMLADLGDCEAIASAVFERNAFKAWYFTRDQLAELLESLLDRECITAEFERDARSLLLEWHA